MNSRARRLFLLAFAMSLALHGVAFASLTSRSFDADPPALVSTVSLELEALKAAEPVSVRALPEAPAPRSVTPAPAPIPVSKAAPVAAAAAPATPQNAAPPLDLSGVTLSNDSGSGFALPLGDGSALHRPFGVGGDTPAQGPPARAVARAATALVAAQDLSEHPRPPTLADVLRANYPEQARQRGLGGRASVRARIDADGVIRSARLVSESSAGFGSACQRTVIGSRWSVPRAKNGDAVATEIVYTCHFEVDR